jgi:YD repeat-containing protein
MRISLQVFILFIFLGILKSSFAQHEPTYGIENIRNVVPPSPEASSLGKYGDLPVSLYTGIPQTHIPIYTIQERGMKIPISLNYHAGGIKVEEHSSWVGLGWSLSAGGVITRSIVGRADDETGGYFTQPYDLEGLHNLSASELNNVFMNVNSNVLDVEPDIYSFNFLNNSGKFIVDKVTRKGISSPKQNLKIEILNYEVPGDSRIKGWKITDEFGNIYFFEEIERTDVRSHTATNRDAYVRQIYVSSWYLSKIILANQSIITFNYQAHSSNYFSRQGAAKYLFEGGGIPGTFTCTPPSPDYDKYLDNRITGKHIESISFSNGLIKFIKSTVSREDMPGDYSLDMIEIYNSTNSSTPIKKVKLGYSYFSSNAGLNVNSSGLLYNTNFQKRLRLDKVEEINGVDKKTNTFEYFTGELPSVFSNSQDHWGFYNGANNPSLVPLDKDYGYGSSSVSRGVSFNFARIGTLSKINYPTGGFTEFVYESNEASITDAEYNTYFYPYGQITRNEYDYFGAAVYQEDGILSDTFVVHPDSEPYDLVTQANIYYNVELGNAANCDGGDRTCSGTLQVTVTCLDCENISSSFTLNSCQFNNGSCWGYIKLLKGKTYVLKISRGYEFSSVSASVGGRVPKPPTPSSTAKRNIYVGGLRIKSIIDKTSPSQQANKTDYYYTSSPSYIPESQSAYESSGIMTSFPVYDSYNVYLQRTRLTGGSIHADCLFKLRTASTRVPLGGMEGTVVGYSDVQTYKTDGNDKLKTITSFYSANDYPDEVEYTFPFVIELSNSNLRGMLKREVTYTWKNNQFIPVKEVENLYESKPSAFGYNPGVRSGINVFMPQDMGQGNYTYKTYKIPSEFIYLKSTDNTVYDASGTNPITTTTNYFYESQNHYNLTRTEIMQSKGQVVSAELKYPHDFSSNPVYSEMVNRHIISPVIERVEKNVTLNKQLNKAITEYDLWNNNILIEPKFIKKSIGNNSLETEVTVIEYDSKGNIIHYIDKTDIPVTILWGYQSNYPVAKILNISSSIAKSHINQSILDNPTDEASLRNHLNNLRSISGAMVTTYTYKPLIGMTSETDPNNRTIYYEYDAFNRLSIVRDQENKIIKKICYNYAGQPDICSDAPSYQLTGNTRCKPCPSNNSYLTNILQNERKDMNPNSLTYNQTDWVDAGTSTTCITAVWVSTTTPVRCMKNSSNQNTGYVEREEKDINPCSNTYNVVRWVVGEYNTALCPLPVACNSSTCSGVNKKCVNGNCETGIMVIDTYERDEMGRCMMYYHYEWSDGSQSVQYSQASHTSNCD